MELKNFNAWGMVSVKDSKIAVILSGLTPAGKPLNRTLNEEAARPLDFSGTALIAVSIEEKGYSLGVHELDKTNIAEHPEVLGVLNKAIDWLKQSL